MSTQLDLFADVVEQTAQPGWEWPGAWYSVGYRGPMEGGGGVAWFASAEDARAEGERQCARRASDERSRAYATRLQRAPRRVAELRSAWERASAGEPVRAMRNGSMWMGARAVAEGVAMEARDDAAGFGPLGAAHPACVARRAG